MEDKDKTLFDWLMEALRPVKVEERYFFKGKWRKKWTLSHYVLSAGAHQYMVEEWGNDGIDRIIRAYL